MEKEITQIMLRVDRETLDYIDDMVRRLGHGMNRNVAVNMMVMKCKEYDELVKLRFELDALKREVFMAAVEREG